MATVPEGMLPVDDFARLKGITPEKAIKMVRDGFYSGRKVGDDWFVDAIEATGKASKPASIKTAPGKAANEVVITDIHMPFTSMVSFMVKWVIASIPAFIILVFLFMLVSAIFGGVLTGFNRGY
jgi:hypothetical protein